MLSAKDITGIFRASPHACLVMASDSPVFTIVEASDAFLNMTLNKYDQIIGKSLFEVCQRETAVVKDITDSLQQVVTNKVPHKMDVRKFNFATSTKTISEDRYWSLQHTPVIDNDGKLSFIILSVEDVTQQIFSKNAEAELEKHLKAIFNGTLDSILLTNDSAHYVRINPAAIQMLGYPEDEFLKLSVADIVVQIVSADEGVNLWDKFKAEGSQRGIIELRKKDGSIISCQYNAKANILPGLHLSILREITEQKKLEDKLKQSEYQFRSAFEHSEIGMAIVGPDGRYRNVNRSLCDITGYKDHELLTMKFQDITHPDDRADDMKFVLDLMEGKRESGHRDKRYIHKNGSEICVSVRVSTVRDINGTFVHFVSQVEDITERKYIEALLKKSEQELNKFFTLSQDALCITGMDGYFKKVNPALEKILGYTANELLSRPFMEFIYPDDSERSKDEFTHISNGNLAIDFINRLVAKDGTLKWMEWKTVPILEAGVMYSVARDITEKKKLETLVKLEQMKFSKMFSEAPISMCILRGPEHIFESANELFYKLTGSSRTTIGKTIREAYPEVAGQGYFELLDNVYKTGMTFSSNESHIRINVKGVPRDFYINYMYQPYKNADGAVEGIFYFGVDITEEILARRRIGESEKQYRDLIQNLPVAVYTCDVDGKIILYNKAALALWGREPDIGNEFWCGSEAVYQTDGTLLTLDQSPIAIALKEKRPVHGKEVIIKRPDGGFRNIVPYPSPLFDVEGNLKGGINVLIDITERKQAEEEFKKLSLIARKTVNAVIITDHDGKIEWINDAFTRITEFEFHEVVGKNFAELLQGDKTDVTAKKLMNHKIKKGYAFEGEIMKYTKSGKPFWVEVSGQPILNAKGELSNYFMMETDTTERKKAYQKLLKKENEIRSFAVQLNNVLEDERSRIAREIHDEFGQQLTGLKMSLSSLQKFYDPEKKSQDIIHDMITGVENTIRSLRNFATELRPGILDTLGLVPSIEWLGKSFEKKTGIECSLKIEAKSQIFEKTLSTAYFRICQEGLTNIVKHADATKVIIEVTQHDGELTLKITDNGKGIVPDSLEDPFSMGLLGIRERASLIGATLEINSTKNTGTSIQITTKL